MAACCSNQSGSGDLHQQRCHDNNHDKVHESVKQYFSKEMKTKDDCLTGINCLVDNKMAPHIQQAMEQVHEEVAMKWVLFYDMLPKYLLQSSLLFLGNESTQSVFGDVGVDTETSTHTHRKGKKSCTLWMLVLQQLNRKERKWERTIRLHLIAGMTVRAQGVKHCTTELPDKGDVAEFVTPSLYFTERLVRFNNLSIVVLISDRDVTHVAYIYHNVPRNLYMWFYLNRFRKFLCYS